MGKYTREKARIGGVGVSPLPVPYVCPSQDGPPILGVLCRAIPSRLLPIFTDFSDFLGRLLVIVEFYSHDHLFTYMFFFQKSSSGEIASSNV